MGGGGAGVQGAEGIWQPAEPSPALTSLAGDRHSSASCLLWLCPWWPGALLRGWGLCRPCELSSRTWTLAVLGRGPQAPSQAWSIHTQPAGCRQRAKPVSLCSSSDPQPSQGPEEPLTDLHTQQAPRAPLWPREGPTMKSESASALMVCPSAWAHTPAWAGRPPGASAHPAVSWGLPTPASPPEPHGGCEPGLLPAGPVCSSATGSSSQLSSGLVLSSTNRL